MSVAATTAIAIGTVAAAGAGAVGSTLASGEQAGAANNAQALQAQEAQNALNFQEQQYNTQQTNEAPWIQAGQGAVGQLAGIAANQQPWTGSFQAPTAAQAAQTPGYQFQFQQGENALQNSAAAAGGLTTGATGAALQQYGQGLASTDYQQVYNNAFQNYQQGYQQFLNNQNTQFNQLASVAGLGQNATQSAGQTGQAAANNVGNISLTSGAQQGQQINNAAAANASGYVGAGNAAASGINGVSQALTLQSILSGQNSNAANTAAATSSGVPYGGY